MAQTFALVTGCSSGIGKELSIAFAARGVTVLATARRVESLHPLTSKYANIEAFALELDDPESIEKLRDAVSKRTGGRLDYLVNNAGTHYASTALDIEIAEVEKLFQVNLFAVMRLCQVFIPILRRSSRARIVQIGSVTRSVPVVWQGAYNASKAALSQYSKTLCLEVKPLGIEVIEIVTGFVQSNILHHGLHAPDTSLYLPIKRTIEEIKYRGNANGMPTEALAAYFDLFQDASPIHSKELFFRRYQSSQCSEDLVSAMVTITAKLIGFTTENDGLDLDAGLDFLLSSSLLGEDLIGEAPSLDQFRKAYLLAFYEFHQFPGHLSWLRISRVSRMAYRIGLDRLDHIRTRYADWRVLSDEDIQEWRSLWWCIYRVDSYSNMASGTPYLIDDALINTSLSRSLAQAQATHSTQKLYLRPDAEQLSKLLLAAPSDPDTLLENIHNITVATVRQAGSLLRKHLLRSREKILAQVASIERLVATVRLALPAGWLSPRRNAFSNESHVAHHARLITIAHLRMAQLLLALASCDLQPQGADDDGNGGGGGKWRGSWQHVLEACQDIAAVAEQWDSAYCLAVDPAISLTIFTALIFLDLHRKTATVAMGDDHTNTFRPGIDHAITILHLQLRSFGQFWTIARLLRLSFDSFSQAVSGPLSSEHVALFLSRFEAPLHPRWLQFLSSAHVELAGCQ
ncbi:NAD(P)-binding protein [Aspergillus lucknowensis]|uniref:NAD(P)-binding protein n=1 Tax=Aspergillus lucknowensis TaxID=176173 RepID=A0ABR4LPP5_9EURO